MFINIMLMKRKEIEFSATAVEKKVRTIFTLLQAQRRIESRLDGKNKAFDSGGRPRYCQIFSKN